MRIVNVDSNSAKILDYNDSTKIRLMFIAEKLGGYRLHRVVRKGTMVHIVEWMMTGTNS